MDATMEDATVEDVPGDTEEIVHPTKLVNETPAALQDIFYFLVSMVTRYGWFMLFALVLILVLHKRLQTYLESFWSRREEEQDLHRYDNDAAYQRQMAMDAARLRMQREFDQTAAKYAEEQQKKEEEKRKEKIADWDRHQEGKGYKSKYKPPPTADDASGGPLPKKKTTYRQTDYNPLTGEGGATCSYRPPAARGGMGGGG
jgi:selenoprotein S